MGENDFNEYRVSHCFLCKFYNSFTCSFKKDDCDLSDKLHPQRPTILDNDVLKASVKEDSCQSTRDLARKNSQIYHVQLCTMEKKTKEFGFSHVFSRENQVQHATIYNQE